MAALLKKNKLTVVEWFGIAKWLSLRYVLHLARTTGESSIAGKLYTIAQRLKLHNMPLVLPVGDNMVAVIKKTG